MERGDLNIAERYAEQALALSPGLAAAWVARGRARLGAGRIDAALDDLERAIGIDPNLPEAQSWLGFAQMEGGDFRYCFETFNSLVHRRYAPSRSHYFRGFCEWKTGKLAAAQADFTRALELDPNPVGAWANRGMLRFLGGQYASSFSDLSRAHSLSPQDYYISLWMVIAADRAGIEVQDESGTGASPTMSVWGSRLLQVFMGEAAPDEVLLQAKETHPFDKDRHCEAVAYIGMFYALRDVQDRARSLLQEAVDVCPTEYIEHDLASSELGRAGNAIAR